MKVTKVSELFEIEEKGTQKEKTLTIFAEKTDGKLTLTTNRLDFEFQFIGSKPEMVEKVAKMILRASKL